MNWSCPCCKAEFEVELKPLAVLEPVRKAPKKVVVPLAQYGEYGKIRMKESEYESLLAEYGAFVLDHAVKGMDSYLASHGKSYKDYRAALKGWIMRDIDRNPYLKEKMPLPEKKEKTRTKWEDD